MEVEVDEFPPHILKAIEVLREEHGLEFPWTCQCTFFNEKSVASCRSCQFDNPTYNSTAAAQLLASTRDELSTIVERTPPVKLGREKKRLIVVLHLIREQGVTLRQRAVNQATIAFENGADGVFLIIAETGIAVGEVVICYQNVRTNYPDHFIGINFLSDGEESGTNLPMDADGIWTDFGVDRSGIKSNVSCMHGILKEREWTGLHFGGFFLKGYDQRLPEDESRLEAFVNLAKVGGINVLTTSGPGTAMPISLEQISRINAAAKGFPIALASGVDDDNISDLLPFVDYFIIGTGVERDATDLSVLEFCKDAMMGRAVMVGSLDGDRVARLADKIHAYETI